MSESRGTITGQATASFDTNSLSSTGIMVASGTTEFGQLTGNPDTTPRTHNIVFDIPFPKRPQDNAVVHVAPSFFGNISQAINFYYRIHTPTVSVVGTAVRVNVSVDVGDSDGWLQGLNYLCISQPA
jgi:hypothetical protein